MNEFFSSVFGAYLLIFLVVFVLSSIILINFKLFKKLRSRSKKTKTDEKKTNIKKFLLLILWLIVVFVFFYFGTKVIYYINYPSEISISSESKLFPFLYDVIKEYDEKNNLFLRYDDDEKVINEQMKKDKERLLELNKLTEEDKKRTEKEIKEAEELTKKIKKQREKLEELYKRVLQESQ